MKKEMFDFLWKIIDKFGFPVLGAFLLSIASLVLKPEQCIKVVPFPDNKIYWACAILTIAYTLIIAFLRTVWNDFREKRYWNSCKVEMDTKEEKKAMQDLWDRVDDFPEDDRNDIKKFLETDNKPIVKYGHYFSYNSMYKTNWVVSTEKYTTEDTIGVDYKTGEKKVYTRQGTHLYKLHPEIFKALKYSMEAYGKISNFD